MKRAMKRRRSTKLQATNLPTNEDKKTKWYEEEQEVCEQPDIGKDLMFEILVRLPIMCLLSCKAVSKYWYKLIRSLEFIKFQMRYACDDSRYTHHKLVKLDRTRHVRLLQGPLLPTLCDPTSFFQLGPMSHPMEFLSEESCGLALTFVGSCRGLICIAGSNHRVVVWNPALRKCKRLPYFGSSGYDVVYGFGYDESSDDFKIVGIRNYPTTLVKIYSARANSWMKLEEDGFEVGEVDDHGCFLKGNLHWATKEKSILTINLSSERFGVMEPPQCVRAQKCCDNWNIQTVGDFLGVFGFFSKRTKRWPNDADLWIMQRYGVKESWSRVNDGSPGPSNNEVVYPQGSSLHPYAMYVAPFEPSEAWQTIPIPSHMTSNAIKAFLIYSFKCNGYPFHNPQAFCRYFYPSQKQLIVYAESLVWPFMSVSRG